MAKGKPKKKSPGGDLEYVKDQEDQLMGRMPRRWRADIEKRMKEDGGSCGYS